MIAAANANADAVDVALLVVRLFFGVGLAYHGYRKVAGGIAVPPAGSPRSGCASPSAGARGETEIGGGLLLALGLLTPLAAAVIGTMLVAGWIEHRQHFLILKNGWELVASYAVGAWAVAVIGPGRFSLDHAFAIDWSGWTGMLVATVLGIAAGIGTMATFWRPADVAPATRGRAVSVRTPTSPRRAPTASTRPGLAALALAHPDGDRRCGVRRLLGVGTLLRLEGRSIRRRPQWAARAGRSAPLAQAERHELRDFRRFDPTDPEAFRCW